MVDTCKKPFRRYNDQNKTEWLSYKQVNPPHKSRSQTPIWIPIAESVLTQNIYKLSFNSDIKVITITSESDSDKFSEIIDDSEDVSMTMEEIMSIFFFFLKGQRRGGVRVCYGRSTVIVSRLICNEVHFVLQICHSHSFDHYFFYWGGALVYFVWFSYITLVYFVCFSCILYIKPTL